MKKIFIIILLFVSCSYKDVSLYQIRYFDKIKNEWIERHQEEDGSYLPYLIGGVEKLSKNIKYPEEAKESHIEGNVYAICYIDDYGKVRKVEIQKGLGYGCDEVTIKALEEAKFLPGLVKGEPVKVKVTIPIRFDLKNSK